MDPAFRTERAHAITRCRRTSQRVVAVDTTTAAGCTNRRRGTVTVQRTAGRGRNTIDTSAGIGDRAERITRNRAAIRVHTGKDTSAVHSDCSDREAIFGCCGVGGQSDQSSAGRGNRSGRITVGQTARDRRVLTEDTTGVCGNGAAGSRTADRGTDRSGPHDPPDPAVMAPVEKQFLTMTC